MGQRFCIGDRVRITDDANVSDYAWRGKTGTIKQFFGTYYPQVMIDLDDDPLGLERCVTPDCIELIKEE